MPAVNSFAAGTVSGIAGAVSVNLVHEIVRKTVPAAPRMDIVGMRAVAGIASALGSKPPDRLRTTTFAADLVANSLYYSLVGLSGPEHAVAMGAAAGALAGAGGVLLPPRMGLGDEEVNRTRTTQAITFALYLGGGLIAGLTYRALAKNR